MPSGMFLKSEGFASNIFRWVDGAWLDLCGGVNWNADKLDTLREMVGMPHMVSLEIMSPISGTPRERAPCMGTRISPERAD
jgi:hypothetical protein